MKNRYFNISDEAVIAFEKAPLTVREAVKELIEIHFNVQEPEEKVARMSKVLERYSMDIQWKITDIMLLMFPLSKITIH